MNVVSNTDIGTSRAENQDRVIVRKINESTALAVLCDGMGGENAGSEASEIAIKIIYEKIIEDYYEDSDKDKAREIIIKAAESANSVIYNLSRKDESRMGMGTTCVICLVTKSTVHIVNVGDSRAYILNCGKIEQITNDHTFVKMLYDKGEIEKHEMKSHPKRNYITKAVGVESEVEPDYFEAQREDNSIIMLCSDGLTNSVSDEEIKEVLESVSIEEASQILIRKAIENEGKDNISLALLKI